MKQKQAERERLESEQKRFSAQNGDHDGPTLRVNLIEFESTEIRRQHFFSVFAFSGKPTESMKRQLNSFFFVFFVFSRCRRIESIVFFC